MSGDRTTGGNRARAHMRRGGHAAGAVLLALCLAAVLPADAAAADEAGATAVDATATERAASAPAEGLPRIGPVTRLPVPRYVSLRSGEVNVRRGPGLDHRKDWVFRRAGLPVQIVEEYGDWRRIVDRDGASGWVFHALLSGRRTALITADGAVLRRAATNASVAVAAAEEGVVARLRRCARDWCQVEKDGYRGWLPKTDLWGADAGEVFPR